MEHPRGVQFKFFCRQGEEYCLASGEFLRVTMLAEAAECLVKAAECFSKDRSWTRAAKALENACDIRIKLGPPEKTTAVAVATSHTRPLACAAQHPVETHELTWSDAILDCYGRLKQWLPST